MRGFSLDELAFLPHPDGEQDGVEVVAEAIEVEVFTKASAVVDPEAVALDGRDEDGVDLRSGRGKATRGNNTLGRSSERVGAFEKLDHMAAT